MSLALEKWLSEFNQVYLIAESIKDFFSPISALAVFYFFVHFPHQVYTIMKPILKDTTLSYYILWKALPKFLSFTLLVYIRLGIIVTVCNQLQSNVGQSFSL